MAYKTEHEITEALNYNARCQLGWIWDLNCATADNNIEFQNECNDMLDALEQEEKDLDKMLNELGMSTDE